MSMKFVDFCHFCERISTSPRQRKFELLQSFITNFRTKQNGEPSESFFHIMRLLLPHLDRARGAYGIKETSLAKLYIKVLCLSKEGVDAQRLITYRYIWILK